MKTSSSILSALFLSVLSMPSMAQEAAVPAAEHSFMGDVSTVAETSALVGGINRYREESGLRSLAEDARLSKWAAGVFSEGIAARGELDVTVVRNSFAAKDVRILRGVVTHRGAKSGAEFSKHWAEDPQWKAVMLGDFTHIGAQTQRRSDGKLVAFVYLIKK